MDRFTTALPGFKDGVGQFDSRGFHRTHALLPETMATGTAKIIGQGVATTSTA